MIWTICYVIWFLSALWASFIIHDDRGMKIAVIWLVVQCFAVLGVFSFDAPPPDPYGID